MLEYALLIVGIGIVVYNSGKLAIAFIDDVFSDVSVLDDDESRRKKEDV